MELIIPKDNSSFEEAGESLQTCLAAYKRLHMRLLFKMIIKKDGEYFYSAEFIHNRMVYFGENNSHINTEDFQILNHFFKSKISLLESIKDKII